MEKKIKTIQHLTNYFEKLICCNTITRVEIFAIGVSKDKAEEISTTIHENDYNLRAAGHLGATLEYKHTDGRTVNRCIGVLTSSKRGTKKIGTQLFNSRVDINQYMHNHPLVNIVDVINGDTLLLNKFTTVRGVFINIPKTFEFASNQDIKTIMFQMYNRMCEIKSNMVESFSETSLPNKTIDGPQIVDLETNKVLMQPVKDHKIDSSIFLQQKRGDYGFSQRNLQASKMVEFIELLVNKNVSSKQALNIISKYSDLMLESFNELNNFYDEDVKTVISDSSFKTLSNTEKLNFFANSLPSNIDKKSIPATTYLSKEFFASVESIQQMRTKDNLDILNENISINNLKNDFDPEH